MTDSAPLKSKGCPFLFPLRFLAEARHDISNGVLLNSLVGLYIIDDVLISNVGFLFVRVFEFFFPLAFLECTLRQLLTLDLM
jgi:hypothetical protein